MSLLTGYRDSSDNHHDEMSLNDSSGPQVIQKTAQSPKTALPDSEAPEGL